MSFLQTYMTNRNPIAALFDMDGVIVPNAPYHMSAWFVFAEYHHIILTEDDYLQHMNGHIAKDSLEFIFNRTLMSDDIKRFTNEKETIYRDLYRDDQAPTPGLISFLDDLKVHQVRRAVGTSAPASNVDFTLDGLHIRAYFDTIVDASMVQHGKPDPEIYLKAAEHLGVPPARCVVFEDAFAGIEAGLRGGMKVIALATTHTRAELADKGAHLIVDDFTRISAATIFGLVDGSIA